jgi:ATP-dependent Clp protease protease subunit
VSEKTDFEKVTEGVDFKNRRIFFGNLGSESANEIAWDTVETVIRAIHKLSENSQKPIELHMSSPGGSALEMLRLYDVIQSCPCQIKFFGGGEIASAATWIMAGCDERYLYPNTRICIHDSPSIGTDEVPTKITDRKIWEEEDVKIQDMCNRIFADNSRMPVEFWEVVVKRDLWLSAEEAITLGLADKIIEPKKRGNLRRARIALLNKNVDPKSLRKLVKSIGERIHQDKSLKIELHTPHEEFDKSIFVDDSAPVEEPVKEEPKED